jgi:hypothetical protein
MSNTEEETVTIPKEAFMALLDFANRMLAQEASANRQRPSEDYAIVFGGERDYAIVFGGEREVFAGYQDELLDQSVERLKKEGKWPSDVER